MGRKKKEKMETLDKRYMLFLFGDFSLTETFADEISYHLISVVSSKFLKFNYGEFGMVCHFRSGETFDNLKEYVDMVLNDTIEQYFLVDVGDNFDMYSVDLHDANVTPSSLGAGFAAAAPVGFLLVILSVVDAVCPGPLV